MATGLSRLCQVLRIRAKGLQTLPEPTKGNVERSIRYIRSNFWPVAFVDAEDLNRQVAWWCDQVANVRIHGTTREQPIVRFQAEKLQPLPATRYELACAGL
jgi:hypothetical protein